MSIPYMPLYVADYVGDTQHLSTEQHGAYLLLLMALWRAGGRLPNDQVKIARIVRLSPSKWSRIADDVMAFFTADEDGITQKRLAAEIEKASKKSQVRSEAGKAGAEAKALKNNKPAQANASRLLKHSSEPEPEPEETGSTEPVTRAQQDRGDFPAFWLRYPAKVGRGAAEKSYAKALKAGATHADLMAGLAAYIANKPPDREWCHASTWLNQCRWTDEWPSQPSQPRSRHERRDDSDRPSRVGTLLAGLADAAGLDPRGHRRDEPSAAWDGPELDAEAGARDGGFELRSLPLAGGSSGSGAGHRATVHGFPRRASFAG